MTDAHDTLTIDEAIEAALAKIDGELSTLLHRELVSSDEVADLLLDVRTLLARPAQPATN